MYYAFSVGDTTPRRQKLVLEGWKNTGYYNGLLPSKGPQFINKILKFYGRGWLGIKVPETS